MKLIIGRRCMFPHNYDRLIKWYDGYEKRKAQGRVNAYCLAPLKMVGLVHVRGRKKRDKNFVFDRLICVLSIRSSKKCL